MQSLSILLISMIGLVTAQTTSSSAAAASSTGVSGCGTAVDTIINSCLDSTTAQLSSCAQTDYTCLCYQYTNVLTCYNNCPSDPNAFGARQNQQQFCQAASAYPSTSSSTVSATGSMTTTATDAAAVSSSLSAQASASSASELGSPLGTATATAEGSSTGAAGAVMATPAVVGIVAVFGVAAML